MTKEHKEHNFHGLFFTIVVFILVLAGGARGHSQREQIRQADRISGVISRDNILAKAVVIPDLISKRGALLVKVTESAILTPSISGISALVQEIGIIKPVFSFNSQKQWSAASLAKLVTAVVAIENLSSDQIIKVSPAAIATESSAGNLVSGKSYPLMDLLRVMMVFSSNDAAVAIAEHFGKENFVSMMNKKASEMGMSNTRFFDSSGLSPLDLTTAEDLNRLVNYIFTRHINLLTLSQEKIEGATHPFAGYSNFIGGKTGFIDEAGGNLVSLFNYRNRAFAVIVLGSKQRAEDTEILSDWFLVDN
ncbi:MAG: serine hydrolase [bacterium]|nr:serine hydrolase [bacterium]